MTINVKFFKKNHEKTCPNESSAGARTWTFLSLYLGLVIFLLSISGSCHPHILALQNQNVNLWADLSLCSPLTVLHISSYRSIPPSRYRATHNSLCYSAYCRHTYVHVHTNPHTPRPPQDDDRMCKYTTWKHAQTQMPDIFSIKLHAPAAYPGGIASCDQGFNFIHICQHFKICPSCTREYHAHQWNPLIKDLIRK